jgi:hypothetical protein
VLWEWNPGADQLWNFYLNNLTSQPPTTTLIIPIVMLSGRLAVMVLPK